MPDLLKVEYQQVAQSILVNELGCRKNAWSICLNCMIKKKMLI